MKQYLLGVHAAQKMTLANSNLNTKTVLITGASSGIGLEAAAQLAIEGY
ncbi:short chain dehydrogenase [Ruegeria denitrificans]|uniref:Short chain dehydrogenase n=1 Tax=Ruegeria denitrificans TaxID=1715692 RepID=A0A0P1IZV5_9RHOB|nr:hypothetical protein [Ruegeria denitrificans]CUK18103.1 short chain dehydrogenase [Ruegeria denitrificans]